jgi:hypothetical protein
VAQQTLQVQSSVQTVEIQCRLRLSVQSATLKFRQEPNSARAAELNYNFLLFLFDIALQVWASARNTPTMHLAEACIAD